MKLLTVFGFLFSLCLTASSHAKPSYSFGDEPRVCKVNDDCEILMVDCHNCGWADAVNKKSLKASKKIVKDYCDGWKKKTSREKSCDKPMEVKKREAVCNQGLCEARSYPK